MSFLNISPLRWALSFFSASARSRRLRSFGEESVMGYAVEYFDQAYGWTRVALEWSPATAMALIAYLREDDASIAMRVVRVSK